jgi:hypothetical protein
MFDNFLKFEEDKMRNVGVPGVTEGVEENHD